MKTIEQILQDIRPEFDFSQSQDFIGGGMLDSFDVITLVSALDAEFGVSIPGVDIVPENFQNVAAIQSLLDRLKTS